MAIDLPDNSVDSSSKFGVSKIASFSAELPVVEDNGLTDTTSKPDLSTICAPDIGTTVPGLSNMYVVTGASSATAIKKTYVSYNSMAMISVTPLNTELLKLGTQFYGFYIVLPKNITASLTSFQESANTFVNNLQNDPNYVNLTNILVYQLRNTTDGREVFYFRPNDGATSGNATVDKTDRPQLALYVHTGTASAVGDNTSVQVNANTDDDISTNDVLFAGYGRLRMVTY
ncbi:hypothetical protein [Levilactobacillus sp. N40-8-2]|uniref:hypothetical protein n=1 Tax=Levilactobacillus muriae TaxID=3238987 RepID=UPI0038B3A87D